MNSPTEPERRPKTQAEYEKAQARRSVVAAWRRVDLTGAEKAWANKARPMGQVVPGVLQHLRLDARKTETEIVRVWNHLLDSNITAHAQPVGLKHGTLFVIVDNSVWLDEIVRYRRREILERMQSSFGSQYIKKLSFRLG